MPTPLNMPHSHFVSATASNDAPDSHDFVLNPCDTSISHVFCSFFGLQTLDLGAWYVCLRDAIRKQLPVEIKDGVIGIGAFDHQKIKILIDSGEWLKMTEKQRLTVIFHELWHFKESKRSLYKLNDYLFNYETSALGRFYSEATAQFYGSLKISAALKHGWNRLDPGTHGYLIVNVLGIAGGFSAGGYTLYVLADDFFADLFGSEEE